MAAISTVTGEVAPEDLGVTLFHEHLAMVSPGLELNWPQAFDRPAEVENAVALLSRAAAAGVRTLVDLTTIDLGRDITMQQQIGERSEVQIVVATGVHIRASRFLLHAPRNASSSSSSTTSSAASVVRVSAPGRSRSPAPRR